MKLKTILSAILLSLSYCLSAQNVVMKVTMNDGTVQEFNAADVKDVTWEEKAESYTFDINITDITDYNCRVNVVPSNSDVTYIVNCMNESYMDFYNDYQELAEDDIYMMRMYYGNAYTEYGFSSFEDMFLNMFCSKGNFNEVYDYLDPDAPYVVYVYAVDTDLNIISDVAVKKFRTKPASSEK